MSRTHHGVVFGTCTLASVALWMCSPFRGSDIVTGSTVQEFFLVDAGVSTAGMTELAFTAGPTPPYAGATVITVIP